MKHPVFTELFKILTFMATIYIIGIIASYLYSRLMAIISQGVLRDIRNEMFSKMEHLPIRYFDTNTHDFCHSSRFFLMRSRHSSNRVISSSEKPL